MSLGSFDAKEQVRQAIDIVDLVGSYVPLRREGRAFKAICPWHDDSRPSLTVNPQRQSFRCWVCDIGGDVFSFVMKIEGVTFPEAMAMLAERAGIALSHRDGTSNPDEAERKRLLYQAVAWAEQQYHDHLFTVDGQKARQYLLERGITVESMRQFRLGAAPDQWEWLQQQAGGTRFTGAILDSAGLCGQRRSGQGYYDRFKGRVLFSIRDAQSRPVGLGGRVLPGADDANAAKYINSPETPLFSKSNLLYGLDQAKDAMAKSRTALVMEGYTDVVVAHQCGFQNAVAVLGTALGERHIRLLRRFVDRIVLVLDGDEAGRRRTDEVLELFVAADMDLRILTLPDELDPADFLLDPQRGQAAFDAFVQTAVDALEHKFLALTRESGSNSDIHSLHRAAEAILATLAKSPRQQGLASSASQLKEAQILNRLARKSGLGEEALRRRLMDLRRGTRRLETSSPPEETSRATDSRRVLAERWLLEIVMSWPEFLALAREHVTSEQLTCPRRRTIYARCCELADEGQLPTFERLLLEFDDPDLKSLLVELDDEHRAMNRSSAEHELRDLLTLFDDTMTDPAAPAADGSSPATPPAAIDEDVLGNMIRRKRSRQGISISTEG